jgi:GAF domain-containing protein
VTDADDLARRLEAADREIAELRRRRDADAAALARLMEITASLNSTLDRDALLDLVLRSAVELLDTEASSLLLVDEETGDLVFERATRPGDEHMAGTRVPAGQGIAGWVLEHGEPAVVDEPRDDRRFYAGIDAGSDLRTRTLLAVPLAVKDRVIGVVELVNKRGEQGFDDQDVRLAKALSDQAAIAIENARLYARLADAVVTARISYRL